MIQKHLGLISLLTDMGLEIKGKSFWQMIFEEIVKPQLNTTPKIETDEFIYSFIQQTFMRPAPPVWAAGLCTLENSSELGRARPKTSLSLWE